MLQKVTAVCAVLVLLTINLAWAADDGPALQSEQLSRLQAIKQRAQADTVTIGDMHEAGAHYRVLATRLRDGGLETKLDAFLRNPANTTKLINGCAANLPKGMTRADCQTVLTMLRTNGSNTMMQAVASVAYNATLWDGHLIPTGYQGGARYMPVLLPDCRGVNQAILASAFISASIALIPGGEPAGLIGGAFTALLALIAAGVC